MSGDHEKFMALAIQEAEDGVKEGHLPYGGVIDKAGDVLGRGKSVGNSLKENPIKDPIQPANPIIP